MSIAPLAAKQSSTDGVEMGYPGAETLTFASVAMGPGGKAIEFKLLASGEHMQELESAIESCEALSDVPGVYDMSPMTPVPGSGSCS
ncbi:MAG: hypothetical protein R3C01_14795 [Planctomycetaceae bacterium]